MSPCADPYLQAVQLFSEACAQEFKDEVRALLMGSVARNEHVLGRSDIDMACVLRKEVVDVQQLACIMEPFGSQWKDPLHGD